MVDLGEGHGTIGGLTSTSDLLTWRLQENGYVLMGKLTECGPNADQFDLRRDGQLQR